MAIDSTTKDPIDVQILAKDEPGPYIGSIDQGTSSTRFVIFSKTAVLVASAQMEHAQFYPNVGHHEHDGITLWQNTMSCMAALTKAMDLNASNLLSIGITNQRETTLAWNKTTGKPYSNAIVWDDTRTAEIANKIPRDLSDITGLPNSSYFAGTKVKWLLDNVEALRKDVEATPENVCFGTIDSWLLFQLTGEAPKNKKGRKLKGNHRTNVGGTFQTDVTNASRWLFMNLKTCAWDESCIEAVLGRKLPLVCLPQIGASSQSFGKIAECGLPAVLAGIPITCILGDQQAALFGQAAVTPGQAKNTYGTGLFLMMNTGDAIVPSTHGLLTTVAYQLENAPVQYALEGSVSHGGSTIQWLRDNLNLIDTASESETYARKTSSNDGLYFVPAFSGLFAPYWRSDARGCIVGMTTLHTKYHLCRAALEAMCYQSYKVFEAIQKDFDIPLESLKVDGGGTHNELLLQFQADMIQVPVIRPKVMETTSLGAAFGAGLAIGFWKDVNEIQALHSVDKTFTPRMNATDRDANLKGWDKAVSKSMGWVGDVVEEPATTATTTTATAPITPTTTAAVTTPEPKTIDPAPAIIEKSVAQAEEPAKPMKKTVSFSKMNEIVTPPPPPPADNPMKLAAAAGVALAVGMVIGRLSVRK